MSDTPTSAMHCLGAILCVVAIAVTPVAAMAQTLEERAEASLARLVEGRVAGPPVDCISPFWRNRLRVVPYVGLVYGRGDTIYIARVQDPRSLGIDDAAVFDTEDNELCYYDVGRSVDRTGFSDQVVLGPFVPYTKRDQAGA